MDRVCGWTWSAFARSLRLYPSDDDLVVHGFESLVVNDLIDSPRWTLGKVWDWKKHAHINVYETDASVAALESASPLSDLFSGCFGC